LLLAGVESSDYLGLELGVEVNLPVTITVCDTCKRDDWQAETRSDTDGERLAEALERLTKVQKDVNIVRHSCLMGCERACNVAIQGRPLTYVLGKFEPGEESALAIVDYARLYGESETGQVPYKMWPQGVKGHFVARIPLLSHPKTPK
jgi:predicted metal-binding protein